MSLSIWPAAAALALLPAAALAQAGGHAHPADADAPVPASHYVSALSSYQPAADEKTSPDQVWRSANQEVGNAGPMHAMHGTQPMQAAPQPAAAPPDPHAGHGAQHDHQGK
ncbi:hypothetical protein [Noviherbaspirillum suwonense]|uniref:Uncharacterized protein n=1 Tax=Noviherbaspirillum suwonense TaxID=1224511 RepID=A0ABY1Q0L5_9BURK|nr:hypothetical protein [Noviherbaspirillum suwonense]SMP51635.1 hypothetical protein SAMN06295970_10336 [Noviherbaspirillum suwonense]